MSEMRMATTSSTTVLILGSNPSQRSSSTLPFWEDSKSRKILDSWLSIIQLDCHHSILFANVSNDPTDNNRPLRMREVHSNLARLADLIGSSKSTHIVALGKTAEKALTLLRLDYFAMPHPSGLNRKLNDLKYVEGKIKGLQDYLNKP